jgi:hypothetical protein
LRALIAENREALRYINIKISKVLSARSINQSRYKPTWFLVSFKNGTAYKTGMLTGKEETILSALAPYLEMGEGSFKVEQLFRFYIVKDLTDFDFYFNRLFLQKFKQEKSFSFIASNKEEIDKEIKILNVSLNFTKKYSPEPQSELDGYNDYIASYLKK